MIIITIQLKQGYLIFQILSFTAAGARWGVEINVSFPNVVTTGNIQNGKILFQEICCTLSYTYKGQGCTIQILIIMIINKKI